MEEIKNYKGQYIHQGKLTTSRKENKDIQRPKALACTKDITSDLPGYLELQILLNSLYFSQRTQPAPYTINILIMLK